jgi:hypothetical protein
VEETSVKKAANPSISPLIRIFISIILFLAFMASTGVCPMLNAPLPERKAIEKDGRLYSVTESAFRHNGWNYYERALSYADGD